MGDDRGKIMEKRSSMRGWHERGGKKPRKNEILGIALIAVIFLAVMASALIGTGSQDPGAIEPSQKKTPATTTVPTKKTLILKETPSAIVPTAIPAPSIRISSPRNITYDTSTPSIDFTVAGSGLDTVFLSIDGGENVTVPHDGTIAKIDFAKGNPLFIEDFSGGAERWSGEGWSVTNGGYTSSEGRVVVGNKKWDDYIAESKVKIERGFLYFGLRNGEGFYGMYVGSDIKTLFLGKWYPFTLLYSTPIQNLMKDEWSTWKMGAEGDNIKVYLDGSRYIDYTDITSPYTHGNLKFVTPTGALVHIDDIVVYKPLFDAPHNLTLFTNNTAGNASSATVFFTVNATVTSTGDEEKISGMKETISKGGLSVTLERFDIYKEIYVYPSVYKRSQYKDTKGVSALTLTVENTGDTEKPFKLDPDAVILDEDGNQYGMQIYKYMKDSAGLDDQIEQTTIYPGVEREGVIYFEPNVKLSAKKVTLFLYINGEKYEFVFNPFM